MEVACPVSASLPSGPGHGVGTYLGARLGELGTHEYCTLAVAWPRYVLKWLTLLMPSLPCTQVPACAVCTIRLHLGSPAGRGCLGLGQA